MGEVIKMNTGKKMEIPDDVEISVVIGWKGESFYMLTSDKRVGETVLLLELAKKLQLESMF